MEAKIGKINSNYELQSFCSNCGNMLFNNKKQNKMTLEQEKQNLENRLKEIELELENTPKVGDVCWFWDDNKGDKKIGILQKIDNEDVHIYQSNYDIFINCEKITDPYVINFVKGVSKFTIQDLADGECAARNDSGLNVLREVLRKAFPLDLCLISGASDIYLKGVTTRWRGSDETNLPTQSVKDFL